MVVGLPAEFVSRFHRHVFRSGAASAAKVELSLKSARPLPASTPASVGHGAPPHQQRTGELAEVDGQRSDATRDSQTVLCRTASSRLGWPDYSKFAKDAEGINLQGARQRDSWPKAKHQPSHGETLECEAKDADKAARRCW